MATLEEKYMEHIKKSSLITTFSSVRNRMMDLPICPKCERPALRDTRKSDPQRLYITCPVCGYHGPTTMSVKTYMKEHVVR